MAINMASMVKMLAGRAFMEHHNQVAGIVYRNICAEYVLEVARSKWYTPPRVGW